MMNELRGLLFCDPALALYDGEGEGAAGAADGAGEGAGEGAGAGAPAAGSGAGAPAASAGGSKPKVFTQDDVNRILAEDKRKMQKKVETLENEYKRALENQNLTEQQKADLQSNLEAFQAQYRTKEENLQREYENFKSTAVKTAKQLETERDGWKNRFETTEVRRAIQDAAMKGEAYRSDHILAILQPLTKMVPVLDANGKPTGELAPRVHYPTTDAKTGEPLTSVLTAEEAVKNMKERADEFGYLFKSNAQGGIGGSSGTGSGSPGANGGKVDVASLTPAQYRELRKKNPASLGLK